MISILSGTLPQPITIMIKVVVSGSSSSFSGSNGVGIASGGSLYTTDSTTSKHKQSSASALSREFHNENSRSLQSSPTTPLLPSIIVNYTIAFPAEIEKDQWQLTQSYIGSYQSAASLLINSVRGGMFVNTLMQQLGPSSPLASTPIVCTNIIIGQPHFIVGSLSIGLPPSSSPISQNNIVPPAQQNPFTSTLSPASINAKVTKYFFGYCYLFLGLGTLLLFMRFLYLTLLPRNMEGTLAKSSASSTISIPQDPGLEDNADAMGLHNGMKPLSSESACLRKIDKLNKSRWTIYCDVQKALQESKHNIELATINADGTHRDVSHHIVQQALSNSIQMMIKDGYLPREFYEYINMKFTLLDCEPILFPDGFCGPRGLFEDFLLYLMCEHELFSCIFVPPGSTVGGMELIQLYLIKTALAFSLSSIISALIEASDPQYEDQIILAVNVIVIPTVATTMGALCYQALTCSNTFDKDHTLKIRNSVKYALLRVLGQTAVGIILAFVCFLLLVSSIFSTRPSPAFIITNYLKSVFVSALVTRLTTIWLLFVDSFHMQVSVFENSVFVIGRRYCELLRLYKRIEGEDFVVKSINLGGGILSIDYIRDTQLGRHKNEKILLDGDNAGKSITGRARHVVHMDALSKKQAFMMSIEDALPSAVQMKRASLNSLQPRSNPLAARRGSTLRRDNEVSSGTSGSENFQFAPSPLQKPSLASHSITARQVYHENTLPSDNTELEVTANQNYGSYNHLNGFGDSQLSSNIENPIHDDGYNSQMVRDTLNNTLPVTAHALNTNIGIRVLHYELRAQGKGVDDEDMMQAQNEALKMRRISALLKKG